MRQLPFGDLAGSGGHLSGSMPKLRELREDVFFRAEYLYLSNLVSLTGRNIRKACELSGLSRSRLYTLLKKYQIAPPLSDRNRQK
jgi:transcriptional regulator of acetoin/glycerol metabolism